MAKPRIKVGDQVICTYAASDWHKVGLISKVVEHPITGLSSVKASDGFFDELCMCESRFEKYYEPQQQEPNQ